ncbi:hypothetical protein FNF29_03291 [Cafeteria roenbergensis]|uniref:Uncharacterized protein n=1 Tax=Cafeteria roenbergensis TaxID=33653 RepID=A0A5A8CJ56_CAFRO|nr:hypothetical protein FNF29_03291 [Cafeteria roenbergensis]|eukprot:KAA0153103.1 hypothetical protein FNF29_03291 [Cafeteria roenbergensis]
MRALAVVVALLAGLAGSCSIPTDVAEWLELVDSTGHATFDLGNYDRCKNVPAAEYCVLTAAGVVYGICLPESCASQAALRNASNGLYIPFLTDQIPLLLVLAPDPDMGSVSLDCGGHQMPWTVGTTTTLSVAGLLVLLAMAGTTLHSALLRHRRYGPGRSLQLASPWSVLWMSLAECAADVLLMAAGRGRDAGRYDAADRGYRSGVGGTSSGGGAMPGSAATRLAARGFNAPGGLRSAAFILAHRALRFLPLTAAVMFIEWTVAPLLATGPFWGGWARMADECWQWGWSSLVFAANAAPAGAPGGFAAHQCVSSAWLLSVEMQLALVALPVVLVTYKAHAVAGGCAAVALLGALVGVTAAVVGAFDLHLGPFVAAGEGAGLWGGSGSGAPIATVDLYYWAPWLMLAASAGIVLLICWGGMVRAAASAAAAVDPGYSPVSHRTGGFGAAAAAAGLAGGASLVDGRLSWDPTPTTGGGTPSGQPPVAGWPASQRATEVTYMVLARPAAALAAALACLASFAGGGGPVRAVLEWRGWQPLARLTYAAILTEPMVLRVLLLSRTQWVRHSELQLLGLWLGAGTLTYIVAAALYLLVEGPAVALEAAALAACGCAPPEDMLLLASSSRPPSGFDGHAAASGAAAGGYHAFANGGGAASGYGAGAGAGHPGASPGPAWWDRDLGAAFLEDAGAAAHTAVDATGRAAVNGRSSARRRGGAGSTRGARGDPHRQRHAPHGRQHLSRHMDDSDDDYDDDDEAVSALLLESSRGLHGGRPSARLRL